MEKRSLKKGLVEEETFDLRQSRGVVAGVDDRDQQIDGEEDLLLVARIEDRRGQGIDRGTLVESQETSLVLGRAKGHGDDFDRKETRLAIGEQRRRRLGLENQTKAFRFVSQEIQGTQLNQTLVVSRGLEVIDQRIRTSEDVIRGESRRRMQLIELHFLIDVRRLSGMTIERDEQTLLVQVLSIEGVTELDGVQRRRRGCLKIEDVHRRNARGRGGCLRLL